MRQTTEKVTLEEVWRLFKETDRQFKETDRQFKETDRQFKETDRQFKETDRQFKETDRRFKETDKKLNRLERLFTSQWGKLVESLVDGGLVALLNGRGIPVDHTVTRAKGRRRGMNWEFDIIAKNGREVVVVEVKTTLRPDDVKDFLDALKSFKGWMPEYAENVVYGAVAFLSVEAKADVMAQRVGLFVIRATGDGATLLNAEDFEPRKW